MARRLLDLDRIGGYFDNLALLVEMYPQHEDAHDEYARDDDLVASFQPALPRLWKMPSKEAVVHVGLAGESRPLVPLR